MVSLTGKQLVIALVSLVCILLVTSQLSSVPTGVVANVVEQAKAQLPFTATSPSHLTLSSERPLRIVVSEDAAAHDEVIAALLQSWGEFPNADITIFQKKPNRFGSKSVYENLGVPSNYTVMHTDMLPMWSTQHPIPDIIIAATCEVFPFQNIQYLLDNHQTHLFCVIHHADRWNPAWFFLNLQNKLTPWIKRDRVDFVALSHHTAYTLRKKSLSLWDVVKKQKIQPRVHVLPPVFHIPAPPAADPESDNIRYALQGNYEPSRRDYVKVFRELEQAKLIMAGGEALSSTTSASSSTAASSSLSSSTLLSASSSTGTSVSSSTSTAASSSTSTTMSTSTVPSTVVSTSTSSMSSETASLSTSTSSSETLAPSSSASSAQTTASSSVSASSSDSSSLTSSSAGSSTTSQGSEATADATTSDPPADQMFEDEQKSDDTIAFDNDVTSDDTAISDPATDEPSPLEVSTDDAAPVDPVSIETDLTISPDDDAFIDEILATEQPSAEGKRRLTHRATTLTPELTLHLVGSGNYRPAVPEALKSSVFFDANLNYTAFYGILSQTTALIPGFADKDYFTTKASSSVPASLIAGSPLIATKKLLNAYTYLADDCVWLQGPDESEFDVLSRIVRLSFDERQMKMRAARACNVRLVEENRLAVRNWTDAALGRRREREDMVLLAAKGKGKGNGARG